MPQRQHHRIVGAQLVRLGLVGETGSFAALAEASAPKACTASKLWAPAE